MLSSSFFPGPVRAIIRKMDAEYLSKKDLMAYLSIGLATVGRLMKQGLPYVKLERKVLFRKMDVDEYMERHLVKPANGKK